MSEQLEHPTRWRWTDQDNPYGGCCAVYFPDHGSWFRAKEVPYYELELQCTPAYINGDPDTEAWGPVEEHGFLCMGSRCLPENHTHDPEAVKWMNSINSALNVQFLLEEFE
jgi:hypothetical protein